MSALRAASLLSSLHFFLPGNQSCLLGTRDPAYPLHRCFNAFCDFPNWRTFSLVWFFQ